MKNYVHRSAWAPLLVLAVGMQLSADVQARPVAAGAGVHASGARAGAVARPAPAVGGRAQINNVNRDVRVNNVRNTSVNNVNVNRNVVVAPGGGYYHGGWDHHDYHPIATAAAVTTTVAVTAAVVGSVVRAVPSGCVPVNYAGMIYQQCGTVWYQPQNGSYVVINPPY